MGKAHPQVLLPPASLMDGGPIVLCSDHSSFATHLHVAWAGENSHLWKGAIATLKNYPHLDFAGFIQNGKN